MANDREGSVAPKERVNIRYKSALDGQQEDVELPLRILMLGDSTLYGGSYVDQDGLYARLLEKKLNELPGLPGKVEVLNLGVPGANLGTHVRMYRIARETLAADAVVMGVFEDNDLTEWDVQDEITQLAEPSPFSLGCFLLGERPAIVLATVLAQARGCTSALAAFAQIEPRLAAMRAQDGAPPLIIVDYFSHHAEVRSRFESRPNTSFIATAVNGEFVARGARTDHALHDGDTVLVDQTGGDHPGQFLGDDALFTPPAAHRRDPVGAADPAPGTAGTGTGRPRPGRTRAAGRRRRGTVVVGGRS